MNCREQIGMTLMEKMMVYQQTPWPAGPSCPQGGALHFPKVVGTGQRWQLCPYLSTGAWVSGNGNGQHLAAGSVGPCLCPQSCPAPSDGVDFPAPESHLHPQF